MNAQYRFVFVLVALVVAFLVPSAGAGQWKALFGQTVFVDPDTGEQRTALFLRESGGAIRQLTPNTESVGSATFSHDGMEIVLSIDGLLHIMSADGTNRRALGILGGDASLTQTHMVFAASKGNRGKVWTMLFAGGAWTVPVVLATGDGPDVSFDGKMVAYQGGDAFGGIRAVNIDGSDDRLVFHDGEYAKFLPDGRIVFLRDELHPEMWIVDPITGKEEFLGYGRDFSVSSDGWVVYDYDDPVRGWYAIRPDGTGKQLIESEWRTRRGFKVFGDLSPDTRAVSPTGKLSTTWGKTKIAY